MGAGEISQLGSTMAVGFGGYVLGAYVSETTNVRRTAEVNPIKGRGNQTVCQIFSDPGAEMDLEMIIPNSLIDAAHSIGVGSTLTVNSVKHVVTEAPEVQRQRQEAKFRCKIEKKDSMTYS
jgi:hypothetical protein